MCTGFSDAPSLPRLRDPFERTAEHSGRRINAGVRVHAEGSAHASNPGRSLEDEAERFVIRRLLRAMVGDLHLDMPVRTDALAPLDDERVRLVGVVLAHPQDTIIIEFRR